MDKMPTGHLAIVLDLIEKIKETKKVLYENIPYAYPIGSIVHWYHGDYIRSGEVDMHTKFGDPAIRVIVPSSGASVWIDLDRLLKYSIDHDVRRR